MSPVVFLSYSRKDFPFARDVFLGLKGAEIETWFDVLDMSAGNSYLDGTKAAMERATHVVLVVSPYAMASREVAREVEIATQLGRKIVPLLLQATVLPESLRVLQWVDFRQQFDAPLQVLIANLRGEKAKSYEVDLLEVMPRPVDVKGSGSPRLDYADGPSVVRRIAFYLPLAAWLPFPASILLAAIMWPLTSYRGFAVTLMAGLLGFLHFWLFVRVARRKSTFEQALAAIFSAAFSGFVVVVLWWLLCSEVGMHLHRGVVIGMIWFLGASSVFMSGTMWIAYRSKPFRRWMVAYPQKFGWG
jgi:hypothetical protein